MNYPHCVYLKLVANLPLKRKGWKEKRKEGGRKEGRREGWKEGGREVEKSWWERGKRFERLDMKTPFLESKR